MERVTPAVDETIRAPAKKKFMQHPVAGLPSSASRAFIMNTRSMLLSMAATSQTQVSA
jgi:hypothetical protein